MFIEIIQSLDMPKASSSDIALLFVLEQPIISDGEIIISFPFETGDRLPLVVDDQTVPFKFLYLLFISEINLIAH